MSSSGAGTTIASNKKPRYFYGWNVVAAAFLAQLAYAEQFSSMLGLFFKPLQDEFGWSRSAIAAVQTIARVVEAAIAPVVGPFIDRFGPRVLMPIGAVIISIGMLLVTRMTNIWQFYALRGAVTAVGYTFMGAMVTDIAVNNWFIRKRGRAIAITRAGHFMSSVIMVPVAVFVIATSGWRTMFTIFASVTLVTVLIPSAVLMRRRPEDMGLHPDGVETDEQQGIYAGKEKPKAATSAGPEPLWNRREVLATGTFWLLASAFAVDSLAFQGINISLAPYIQDLGYGEGMQAAVLTFRGAMQVVALLFAGFIAERAGRRIFRIIPFLFSCLAAFLFLLAGRAVFLWLAVAVYGLGISTVAVIQEVVWANYFGRMNLGVVRSLGYLFTLGFGAIGPVAMNAVFDVVGSYRPAFVVIIFMFIAAGLLIAISKPARAKRYSTVSP